MMSPITSEYLFISAIPTPQWHQIIQFCRQVSFQQGIFACYDFDPQADRAIDVQPSDNHPLCQQPNLVGTYLPERYYEQTREELVRAIQDDDLDPGVLAFPKLLAGEDIMLVYFWPDEDILSDIEGAESLKISELAKNVFSELTSHAIAST